MPRHMKWLLIDRNTFNKHDKETYLPNSGKGGEAAKYIMFVHCIELFE